MLYIRISLMIPQPAHTDAAIDALDAVANFLSGPPGHLGAYVLQPQHTTGMIGRVTLWEDEASANAVAQSQHMLALRADLDRVIVEESHLEFGFLAERAPIADFALKLRSAEALAAAEEILRAADQAEPPTAS